MLADKKQGPNIDYFSALSFGRQSQLMIIHLDREKRE